MDSHGRIIQTRARTLLSARLLSLLFLLLVDEATRFRLVVPIRSKDTADDFGAGVYELIEQNEFCKPKLKVVKKKKTAAAST